MHRLVPEKVESAVLLLHGLGADGSDLIALGQEWNEALPHTAFFAPDAPFPCDMSPLGYQWFSLSNWTQSSIKQGLDAARAYADQFIDAILKDYALPPSKLVLAGFSQGAMLALHTGLQRKEPLGGLIAMSGAFFLEPQKIISRPPVLLTHGTEDTVVPVAGSQIAAQQLAAAGVDAALHLLKNLGHGIDSACLDLGAKFLHRAFTG